MKIQSLPKLFHLKLDSEFREVFAARSVIRTKHLTIRHRENSLAHSRLGLRVSKKLGNAPYRNRTKRLIREAFRLSQGHFSSARDLVISPKGNWKTVKMQEIQEELLSNF